MTMPSAKYPQSCPPRSAGRVAHAAILPAQTDMAPAGRHFDPVHLTWMEVKRPDDLTPFPDPLGPGPRGLADALTFAGLTLRPWATGDGQSLQACLGDPAVWRHLPEPTPQSLDARAAHGLILAANSLPGQCTRAVVQAGRIIGQVRLEWRQPGADRPAREAEISYWLGTAHWGRGLGSAIVAGAVWRAFRNRLSLLRLTAKVHPENPASARVLEKAGFRRAAPPPGAGFTDWHWFALRRQHAARQVSPGISNEASP